MSELTAAQRDKLMADLRLVVSDAEALLKLSANDASEGVISLRERLEERLGRAREKLEALQESATEKAKAAGHAADDYVHEYPWRSIAIGASVGVIVGLLIGRR